MSRIYQYPENDDLMSYFSSYITELHATVGQIKCMVYSLISITTPTTKIPVINDLHSLMSACKRTYQDMKRVQSILKGRIKSQQAEQSLTVTPNTFRHLRKLDMYMGKNGDNSRILSSYNTYQKRSYINEQISIESNSLNNTPKITQSPIEQAYKYSHTDNQKLQIQSKEPVLNILNNKRNYQSTDSRFIATINHDQTGYHGKLNTIRNSRKRQQQYINQNTNQCLEMIQSIKKQLLSKNSHAIKIK